MLVPALLLIALPFVAVTYLLMGLWAGGEWLVKKVVQIRRQRRNRIEAELDRQQAELRATIWQLASELNVGAHEARKALIRASFEASQSSTDSSPR